jgi:hypothetical protein
MRIIFLVLLIGLFIGTGCQAKAESGAEKAAVSAASTWLATIDRGDYRSSWKEASSYFRGAETEKNWLAAMEGYRKPLGKLLHRKLAKAKEESKLPGAPDRKYEVMLFDASFERKKSALETVTFVLDNDGKWRAAGYFVR